MESILYYAIDKSARGGTQVALAPLVRYGYQLPHGKTWRGMAEPDYRRLARSARPFALRYQGTVLLRASTWSVGVLVTRSHRRNEIGMYPRLLCFDFAVALV